MPDITKKIFIWILAAAMLLPIFSLVSFADKDAVELPYLELPVTVDTMTVGLRSGSYALAEVSLENRIGSGYSFGYFDITRSFRSLGYTDETAISMHGDTGFEVDEDTSVGHVHILLNYYYSGFDNAKETATMLGGFPAFINGTYRVLVGSYSDAESAQKAIEKHNYDATPYSGSSSSIIVTAAGTSTILFMYDNPGVHSLAIKPNSESQQAETWFSGYFYRGSFELKRNGSSIDVINYVDLESYVSGVLPYEMSGSWPIEALKSQAVCARTYAINSLNAYSENGFDVRSDTYSQVYRGITESNDVTADAASSTAGEYVRYKGSPCKVYYMSSDGGATESGENTFKQRRSYLAAVEDPFERDVDHYNEDWSAKYYASEIQYKLNLKGYEMAEIADVIPTTSELGNVIGLKFIDVNGKEAEVFNVDCYKLLGLNSLNYTVTKETGLENEELLYFVFSGHGWGHNCGLSQWGAYAMADSHNMKYNEIINYYFSGAYVR